jgi:hypothetical protein
MTQRSTAARYAALSAGQEEVESCLMDSVAEHLNGGGGQQADAACRSAGAADGSS